MTTDSDDHLTNHETNLDGRNRKKGNADLHDLNENELEWIMTKLDAKIKYSVEAHTRHGLKERFEPHGK